MGLADTPDALLFGVVSRLSWQKGHGPPAVRTADAAGRRARSSRCSAAATPASNGVSPTRRSAIQAGSPRISATQRTLAHLIQAGADAILVPSRFEPCGLTQLCALRYGALPVVTHVGGLADTVVDANDVAIAAGVATGFQFAPANGEQLGFAIDRALALWKDPVLWRRLQARAMATDVGWRHPAKRYASLYRDLGARGPAERARLRRVSRHARSGAVRSSARISSPSDHAWNGQPRGVCGGSPSAISLTWPRPAVCKCASSGARKRRRASARFARCRHSPAATRRQRRR